MSVLQEAHVGLQWTPWTSVIAVLQTRAATRFVAWSDAVAHCRAHGYRSRDLEAINGLRLTIIFEERTMMTYNHDNGSEL